MRTAIVAVCLILLAGPLLGSSEAADGLERLTERATPKVGLQRVEAFLADHPDDYDGLLLKGFLLSQLNQREAAEKVYRSLIRQHPANPEPYNNLAVLLANAGKFEEAAETLKLALGTHPSYRVAYENLGKVYGRFASEAYSQALGVEPPKEDAAERLVMLKRSPSGAASMLPPQEARVEAPPLKALPSAARVSDSASAAQPPPPASPPPSLSQQASEKAPTGSTPPPPLNRQAQPASPDATENIPTSGWRDQIETTVRSWARAWSEQRPDAYLGFYSSGFRVPNGLDRSDWEDERRDRIKGPNTIRVVVRNLQPPVTTARGTAVTFVQSYSSDRFADKVTKTLVFVRENDSWKIIEERVDS